MAESWREEFSNPGAAWRGAPFWAWNGKLDPEELRRQIRDMKEHGMGGFFMHSRAGLQTPYLSREWMDCVKAAVDEAKKTGMLAYIYDEDRWPSGAAGGLVTGRHPEYCAKCLNLKRVPAEKYVPDIHTLWAFTARANGDVLSDVRPLAKDAPSIPAGREALLFSIATAGESGWFNGAGYLNMLDPEPTQRFLDCTLEPYRREVGSEFGKVVPGCFTDEPHYHGADGPPWTERLPEVFAKRYGYDITARLPELFFDVEGADSHRLRRDYHDCITHLFVECFSKPYGERCARLGIAFTGHYLAEETLASQESVIGAAMRHYEHQQYPGIDILCESQREVLTCKQASSAARQFGRERVLSELYGTSGWDFTFEGEKWVGDWQIALGVNLRCQHLTWYTMARGGKRDYPPCFNYQSTSWKYHKPTEDYFARMCYMTTRGVAEREVLLLHPIESAWAVSRVDGWNFRGRDAVKPIDQNLSLVMASLLESHHDFDFGDEELLTRHASVEGARLRVGKATYGAVVVPPAVTWRRSTIELLERFLAAGGKVVVVEPAAERVDCEKSNSLTQLASRPGAASVRLDKAEISSALDGMGVRLASVAAPGGGEIAPILIQRRAADGKTILLLVNTDRERGYEADVTLFGVSGRVEDWDMWTGEVRAIPSKGEQGRISCRVTLPPTGSKLLVVSEGTAEAAKSAPRLENAGVTRLGKKWKFARDDKNSRILDMCRYRIGDESFSDVRPVWVCERDVRLRLDLPPVGNGDVQLWKTFENVRDTGKTVELLFPFKARVRPSREVYLVIERPKDFEIELNGGPVPNEPVGWWIDREFALIDLKGRIKPGKNELLLRTKMRTDTGLEAVYLAGDFGVDWKTLDLVAEPRALKTGDWVKQGYAQYSGSMIYKQSVRLTPKEGERLFLAMEKSAFAGVCFAVKVNGEPAGLAPWPPYEVEITKLVKKGKNDLEIELVGSRRNLFGPLHLKEARPTWVGPGEFEPWGERFVAAYNLVPSGILGDVEIVRRREA